jgi:hypothetical protein
LGILSLLFKPAVKSPEQKLRETRVMLRGWIAESESEIATSDDELWNMGERDNIASRWAQIGLVNELLDKPERCTAQGLEDLLREKFRIYDGLDASLANLPTFDEDEEDLDYSTMSSQERIQRKAFQQYHNERFKLQHQIDILAQFAGVSARRIHDVLHIIGAHYTPVEDRPAMKKELAAAYYPVIREWMAGGRGPIQSLDIPTEFSAWLPEHEPDFPALV